MGVLEEVNLRAKNKVKRDAIGRADELKKKYYELRGLGMTATQAGIASKLGADKYSQLLEELKIISNSTGDKNG